MHFWPANPIAAPAIIAAAADGSASASTIAAFCPPISACTGIPRWVAVTATARPTAAEPVKLTTSAASTRAAPARGPPTTTWNRSAGRASANSSAIQSAQPTASGEGLSSTAFPAASAGAAFHNGMASGKFQGVINPATPCGRRSVSSMPGRLGGSTLPSGA